MTTAAIIRTVDKFAMSLLGALTLIGLPIVAAGLALGAL